MKRLKRMRIAKRILYGIIGATILWQSAELILLLRKNAAGAIGKNAVTIDVSGNVERPGRYRVVEGTSNMEILKVAGVRLSSDLSPFNLIGQVEDKQTLNVGTLPKPVGVNSFGRLEFFLGDISVIAADGQIRTVQEGMAIEEGDRVISEEKAQAELSVNSYSRVDIDNFAEVSFDKIGRQDGEKSIVALFQKSGLCWYKMVYSQKNEQFQIATPQGFITVGGKGADFNVDVKYTESVINNTDGLLLISQPKTGESINLIAGQSVTIYADNRPFKISKLAPGINLTERFSRLSKIKSDLIVMHMPFNFFFCGSPSVYYFISVQFERNRVISIRFPAQTSVSEFAQGIHTMQEAFAYGGPVFASTFAERIMNVRIPKYLSIDKGGVLEAANVLGGIEVVMDGAAAARMNYAKGRQHLKGEKLVEFLLPGLSGETDSEGRQVAAFQGIFDALSSRKLVITAIFADQLLALLETNISAPELLKNYQGFAAKSNWRFLKYSLPVKSVMRDYRNVQEPQLEECRAMLTQD
jgi:hypothetical protein